MISSKTALIVIVCLLVASAVTLAFIKHKSKWWIVGVFFALIVFRYSFFKRIVVIDKFANKTEQISLLNEIQFKFSNDKTEKIPVSEGMIINNSNERILIEKTLYAHLFHVTEDTLKYVGKIEPYSFREMKDFPISYYFQEAPSRISSKDKSNLTKYSIQFESEVLKRIEIEEGQRF
jgi:hypothetical protein